MQTVNIATMVLLQQCVCVCVCVFPGWNPTSTVTLQGLF